MAKRKKARRSNDDEPRAVREMKQKKKNKEIYEETEKSKNNRKRKSNKSETGKKKPKKRFKKFIIVAIVILILYMGISFGIYANTWKTLASDMALNQPSHVVDIDGKTIASLGSQKKKITISRKSNANKPKKCLCSN